MTLTATPIYTADGVTQFELDPLMVIDGHPIRYVVALTIAPAAGRIWRNAETVIYAADVDGLGDPAFFIQHGYIAEHPYADVPRAMAALGYDVVPALRLVG